MAGPFRDHRSAAVPASVRLSALAGGAAVAVGPYLALSPAGARPDWLPFGLIVAAGLAWSLAAATFSAINEYPGATEGGRSIRDLVREQIVVPAGDPELHKLLVARSHGLPNGASATRENRGFLPSAGLSLI